MKRQRFLLSLLVLSLTVFSSGCNDLKKAREASQRLVLYCDAGLQVIDQLNQEGVIDAESAGDLARAVLQIRDATQIFLSRASGLEKFDAKSKEDLARLFVDVTRGVGELQRVGALHLKNPDSIKRFERVMTGLDIAARLVQSRLGP